MRSSPRGPSPPCGTPRTTDAPHRRRAGSGRTGAGPAGGPTGRDATTIDGLNRAAASTEYSWVNQAPTSRRRSSDSAASSGHPVGDPLVVGPQYAAESRCRFVEAVEDPAQGRLDLVLGQREDAADDTRTPGTGCRRKLLTGHEEPRQHSHRVRREDDLASRDALRHPTLFIVLRTLGDRERHGAGLLQRRQQRQCRLRALVLVAAVRVRGRRSRRRSTGSCIGMPLSLAPRNQADGELDAPRPSAASPVDVGTPGRRRRRAPPPRSAAGRSRAGLARTAAADRRHGQVPVAGLARRAASPSSRRPSVDERRSSQHGARGEQRLGQGGVGVARAAARARATPCRRPGRPTASRQRSAARAPRRGPAARRAPRPPRARRTPSRAGAASAAAPLRSNAGAAPASRQVRAPGRRRCRGPTARGPSSPRPSRVRPARSSRSRLWNRPSGSCAASTNAR